MQNTKICLSLRTVIFHSWCCYSYRNSEIRAITDLDLLVTGIADSCCAGTIIV